MDWNGTPARKVLVGPKMAQVQSRHSDIRLTLGLYTHVEMHDRTAAIGALPAPPISPDIDCS